MFKELAARRRFETVRDPEASPEEGDRAKGSPTLRPCEGNDPAEPEQRGEGAVLGYRHRQERLTSARGSWGRSERR